MNMQAVLRQRCSLCFGHLARFGVERQKNVINILQSFLLTQVIHTSLLHRCEPCETFLTPAVCVHCIVADLFSLAM